MRIAKDHHEFFLNTQMIRCQDRLRDLGIEVSDILGSIWPSEIDRVIAFCERNPAFHIVSYFGNSTYINRYDEGGGLFFLAEGDNDPNYMLDTSAFVSAFLPAFIRAIKS